MSNSLKITTKFDGGSYMLHAEVQDHEDYLPLEIFIWDKQEDGTPKEYQSLAYMTEIAKIPIYDVENIRRFGVHLTRLPYAIKHFPDEDSLQKGVSVMKRSFKDLVAQLQEGSIPVEEIYVV